MLALLRRLLAKGLGRGPRKRFYLATLYQSKDLGDGGFCWGFCNVPITITGQLTLQGIRDIEEEVAGQTDKVAILIGLVPLEALTPAEATATPKAPPAKLAGSPPPTPLQESHFSKHLQAVCKAMRGGGLVSSPNPAPISPPSSQEGGRKLGWMCLWIERAEAEARNATGEVARLDNLMGHLWHRMGPEERAEAQRWVASQEPGV
jgi:hypothetical protein